MSDRAIGQRLREIRKEKGQTQPEFAQLIGISQGHLSEMEASKTTPTEPILIAIEYRYSINKSWLLTGEGPKYRGERPLKGPEMSPYEGELVEVKVFALAGAGDPRGLVAGEPIETLVVPKEFAANHILPVRVEGASMEPTLNDGATVGVDTRDTRIVSGKVYAVWLDYEGAVVKRVFVEPERVVLKSDNPLFPSSHVALKDAPEHFVMGRVKWVIQKL